MAILKIPLRSDLPAYEMQIALENRLYTFEFEYNARRGVWVWHIYDEQERPILIGTPLLIGRDLLKFHPNSALPPGKFVAVNETGASEQATRDNLGIDVNLYYQEAGV